MSDKPKFYFEEENAEGDFPSAFRVDGAEIKKGDKAVATDLSGLYDCDVKTTPPVDGNALVYSGVLEKWIPKTIESGGGCNLIEGQLNLYVYYHVTKDIVAYSDGGPGSLGENHSIYDYTNPENNFEGIPTYNPAATLGSYENPFRQLSEAFDFINNTCITISELARVNIIVMHYGYEIILGLSGQTTSANDYIPTFWLDWNPVNIIHPNSDRIFIYGISLNVMDNDVGLFKPPSEMIDNWATYISTYTLGIIYEVNMDWLMYYPEEYPYVPLNPDACPIFKTGIKTLKPLISINNGNVLGGMYNFKFSYPDISFVCRDMIVDTVEDPGDPGGGQN